MLAHFVNTLAAFALVFLSAAVEDAWFEKSGWRRICKLSMFYDEDKYLPLLRDAVASG